MPFLSAVTSLNVQRRDEALFLLATEYSRSLTQYEVCKTVVLSDVFNVVQTGKAIFGGTLYALPYGPVSEGILDDCRRWANRLARYAVTAWMVSAAVGPLQCVGTTGGHDHINIFAASAEYPRAAHASWDSFSDGEQKNIRSAYLTVTSMTFGQSQAYFHKPSSAIGYAYDRATAQQSKPFKGRVEMNWFEVLDGAERIEKRDCSYARTMLGLWL